MLKNHRVIAFFFALERFVYTQAHVITAIVRQVCEASRMCVLPLALNTGSDAVPSKVSRIMACARPVLACADPKSNLAELVRVAQAQYAVLVHEASGVPTRAVGAHD